MNGDVVGPSVAGTPVVYITGFIVLVLLTFARPWVESLVAVAHEGGHMVMAALTNRGPKWFTIDENAGGATLVKGGWGAGMILGSLAGYLTPPLVGLGGVAWC